MAEPSAGRVAVEVIVTLNRCTQLVTGTTGTRHKRLNDARILRTKTFLMDSHDLACRYPRLCEPRLVGRTTTRR